MHPFLKNSGKILFCSIIKPAFPMVRLIYLIFLFTFLMNFPAVAQLYPQWHQHLKPQEISLLNHRKPLFSIPFRNITVLDMRDDTTSLGYLRRMGHGRIFKIIPDQPFTTTVQGFVNSVVLPATDENSPGVLMVIKKVRLTDEVFENPVHRVYVDGQKEWDAGVAVKFEFYLEQGAEYYPLYRFDSILLYKNQRIRNEAGLIMTGLEKSLEKLQTADVAAVLAKRKKLRFAEIDTLNKKKWNISCFNNVTPVRGVYRNYGEFLANKPFYTDFSINRSNRADVLFVTENGVETPVRKDIWGYCNGSILYVKSADKYFPLSRCGNTYGFRGARRVTQTWESLSYNNNSPAETDIELVYGYYQIDIETGQIY
jgi:hypothetical protein